MSAACATTPPMDSRRWAPSWRVRRARPTSSRRAPASWPRPFRGTHGDARTEPRERAIMTPRDAPLPCDELYGLATSPRWAALAGKSSREVAGEIGPPDRVYTLVHEGVTW